MDTVIERVRFEGGCLREREEVFNAHLFVYINLDTVDQEIFVC